MATPNPHQLALLTSASQRLRKDDYRKYLCLKVLLKSDRDEDHQSFGQLFTQYYGLRFVSAALSFELPVLLQTSITYVTFTKAGRGTRISVF